MPSVLPNLHVKVLFFGRLREVTGISEENLELPNGMSLAELFDRYAARFPGLAELRASLAPSRNQEFASWDTALSNHDDVAFLPPVSGG